MFSHLPASGMQGRAAGILLRPVFFCLPKTSMYLLTAATTFEMDAFRNHCAGRDEDLLLVTGVGPMETTLRLMRRLQKERERVRGVINFGVAGAYRFPGQEQAADLLDICLAESEVLGDFGICLHGEIEQFSAHLEAPAAFTLAPTLLAAGRRILAGHGISCRSGAFVTVNCASGTLARGAMLGRLHHALCENMEGAAVARVCWEFSLPCLEIRCISNLVEDRDPSGWQLDRACGAAGRAAALVARHLEQHHD